MKRIRYYFAAFALVVTMSGPVLLGLGAGSMANLAASRYVSTSYVAGQSARAVAFKRMGPCPTGGSYDC
mgnify:CR=1 FL=1